MNGWLAAIDKLRYKAGDILKKEQEIEKNDTATRDAQTGCATRTSSTERAGNTCQEKLGPIVVFAETYPGNRARRQARKPETTERQAAAQKSVKQAKEELTQPQESLATWQQQWHTAISGLGLTGEIATSEASELIDIVQTCFDRVKEAADLQKRIDGH